MSALHLLTDEEQVVAGEISSSGCAPADAFNMLQERNVGKDSVIRILRVLFDLSLSDALALIESQPHK
ncbi:hypothetical protein MOK15_09880 [Sphingobium sp. BYY-5]|uniref:hypothetical protein n=1 Tax=Sphingobium sp. BYY-5 TaxID=2926400 RepID=UPI001FA6F015|nr:hypothetical protein [Sphingobium sp. BYY-5]MCI4590402.1 hypothetical protein [Sphingobium sp. BYY-5]